ncbi:MAG: DNA-3-methyladenine glycosylase I [Methanobacterium sp.]
MVVKNRRRCDWAKESNILDCEYHDNEWGIPIHNEQMLFEMLILEGAQAGLSWSTILKKRKGYRKAFKNFDPNQVALMSDKELELLMNDSEIIRNRLKIFSVRKNAIVFIEIQKEFGSFDKYIWQFVNNKTIVNHHTYFSEIPAENEISNKISKDLKKRGMSFVGTTIIYAFMQAIGMVDDHMTYCFKKSRS